MDRSDRFFPSKPNAHFITQCIAWKKRFDFIQTDGSNFVEYPSIFRKEGTEEETKKGHASNSEKKLVVQFSAESFLTDTV